MPGGKPSPVIAARRARVGALTRHRGPNDPAVLAAARDLDEARHDLQVDALVADWPDLTAEQRDRIAGLVRTADPADGGAA